MTPIAWAAVFICGPLVAGVAIYWIGRLTGAFPGRRR